MNKLLSLILVIAFILISGHLYAQEKQTDFPNLKGPYLGQTPPGMSAKLFAPEVLSRYRDSFCSVFSPCGNEFYFVSDLDWDDNHELVWMRKVNNEWTEPEILSFNSEFTDNDICISPDGFRIFWRSWRPLPGHTEQEEVSYLWFAYRTENGWSKAQPVVTTDGFLYAGYPAVAYNGTIYFNKRSENNVGRNDLFYTQFVKGIYGTPVNLGRTVNTIHAEGDLCISPDESFLVVSCWERPDNNGESDLYISFRKDDGAWTKLINMGEAINNGENENCPMISPDGKFFFFFRYDPINKKSTTCWIDIKIIDTLKPKGIN
ncbi:MAG: hypothetical protein GY863_24080 [bacterium]|nr:hypothetical protein [bacterium]